MIFASIIFMIGDKPDDIISEKSRFNEYFANDWQWYG